MTFPMLQLVASPDAGAAVLFDFHDKTGSPPRHFLTEGFTLGSPEPDGPVDAIDPSWTDRTISFRLRVVGSETTVRAMHRLLARQLLGGSGWLRWQPNALTKPIWFETWRPESEALSFEHFAANKTENVWTLPINIPAEPFAVGAWETISATTINNDPAHATNPCRMVLPAILGDAPTPLRISFNPSNPVEMHGYRWMFAVHSGPTQRTPVVWQIGGTDGWTPGADTSATASSSAYSGGSYRTVSFATDATLQNRISGVAPSAVPVGRYQAFVRTDRTDNASVFSLRMGQRVGVGYQFDTPATVTARTASTAANHACWVDLGEIALPAYAPPKGENPGFSIALDIALQVARVSGTGSLRLDTIVLLPIDTPDTTAAATMFVNFPIIGIDDNGGGGVLAGDREAFWSYNELGFVAPLKAELVGDFPVVVPGETNVLTVLQQVNGPRPFYGNDASDLLTASTVVTLTYRPYYLHTGDSA